ncbi:fungal transcriptional regulatory-like protein [Apodospora peruviana]|uniref:Fungal transcriptional regulatory-like protein n=1 Tax=Apodospora peruviana TaxID=516989 RepID=A0AAE0I4C3_9PEZI|nr:fungal transcriptional regulatory-like protein [Apodospora peruviana]
MSTALSSGMGSGEALSDESPPLPSPPRASAGQPDASAPRKAMVRKRTKTGCLTCRRRRIKCDEGKPTCGNCIKSKRQCDGYNQRLTFKEPLGSFASGSVFGQSTYHQQTQAALVSAQLTAAQARTSSSSQVQFPIIAPRPPSVDFTGLPYGTNSYEDRQDASHTLSPILYSRQHPSPDAPFQMPESAVPSASQPALVQQPEYGDFFSSTQDFQDPRTMEASPISTRHHPSISAPSGHQLVSPAGSAVKVEQSDEGHYWHSDDDASMADSEEDVPRSQDDFAQSQTNDLNRGVQVARGLGLPLTTDGVSMRTFAGTVDQNILQTYTPSSSSSPLNDPQTLEVFRHFVNVTGRIMSLYERHPVDEGPMFQGHAIPSARQSIWTYVFPLISFSYPALMQAMLALGSLQIAKRQGVPPMAAMKHYHLSLRRIAKNYRSPTKRTQPATLAATLLLGFYEVWNSDHEKWCKHMWGARAILREIPLRQMTQDIIALQRRKRQELLSLGSGHRCDISCQSLHDVPEHDPDWLDTNLISQITGRSVSYGDTGSVDPPSGLKYTERDIKTYGHVRDLFWWYCKMDVYQSILGATRPFMEYEHWTQCAPRAQFGRIDAIYGTFDHLMLLLGRVVSFASRDMARKRKARKAEANMPRGPPGTSSQGPGPGGPGGPPGPGVPGGPPGQGRGQSPPMFPGLLPSSGQFDLPKGFSPPRQTSPDRDAEEDTDLDAQTAAAVREWEAIREAFDVFHAHLGPDFQPMGPDIATPIVSPFGPALMYRTYSIAGIWLNYYMGLIVLYRARPSMPPIAMVAAGMSAPETALWANEIGRIAAGLHEDTSEVTDVTTLTAAYRDITQRHWVIRRLCDIERLTGWQSAKQIADGCESAWYKAGQMKRGPQYYRPPELEPLFSQPIWARPRRIDTRIRELEAEGVGTLSGENRLVLVRSEQAHYALGLLSVEQDLERLDLAETDWKKEHAA